MPPLGPSAQPASSRRLRWPKRRERRCAKLAAMNLIWPTSRAAHPSALTRLGRVIHWFALLAAAAWLLLCLALIPAFSEAGIAGGWMAGAGLVGAALIALAGRAVRYVLSSE